jgi:DNA-binding response OmpR family regulator
VVTAADGESARRQLVEFEPDLVLLDLMLPAVSGYSVLQEIRRMGGLPVIVLTARADEADRVAGLELGADDYVTKPFSPRELVARVRAVARRGRASEDTAGHPLRAGDLEIDRQRFEVKMKGRLVELTRKEFDLLAALARTPGRVFGREELLDLVWGQDGFVEPRTVDVHVARLRAKFIAARAPEPGIETVRGVGYRFREPA